MWTDEHGQVSMSRCVWAGECGQVNMFKWMQAS